MTLKIALIDSGLNAGHPHVQEAEEGCGFTSDKGGRAAMDHDFIDTIGHGTAIAGIILEKAVKVELYVAKIFHDSLHAPASFLTASLKWAIEKEVNLIHLSLGMASDDHKAELWDLCHTAHDRRISIVAAARSSTDRIYPSSFETAIGVYWDRDCDRRDLVYHRENVIEFGAHGYARPLPGVPRERNFSGHSFAAAHVTAMAVEVLQQHPEYTVPDLRQALAGIARPAVV